MKPIEQKDLTKLTPREIVAELDRYIVGQNKAKKMVAIALRNRIRRRRLSEELREEVAPKNIIMIGPTGVGKTEIARRISKLVGAPFIKVEATKYTEVGYVGRDVESMVRDLLSVAISMIKNEMQHVVRPDAEKRAEEVLLDLLLPGISKKQDKPVVAPDDQPDDQTDTQPDDQPDTQPDAKPDAKPNAKPNTKSKTGSKAVTKETRERFRHILRTGELDDKEIEFTVANSSSPSVEVFAGSNMEEVDVNLANFGRFAGLFGGNKKKRRAPIKSAREIIIQQEVDKMIDGDQVAEMARERVEQMGIIFIDEIDKIAVGDGHGGIDISREGVQRDILPIVEGSTVNTRYGMIDTAHILFIAAGAFHSSKPSDLIPELQGRFPLRVELEALGEEDLFRILSQPRNALILQYCELMKTEGVELEFSDAAIHELSKIAADVNQRTENIGARRLHTIMELLLEDVSFNASDLKGQKIPITPEYVRERLDDIVQNNDLSRYIL